MAHEYKGTREYYLIFSELINAARYRGTVTYQELAELIDLPTEGNYMGKELGRYLGSISTEEVEHGRPMLSAIAVTTSGKPSSGFFELARQCGKLNSDHHTEEDRFVREETAKVYQTWKKSFHHQLLAHAVPAE